MAAVWAQLPGTRQKGVSCFLDGKEEFLTYRFEGAQHLTEQNPNYSQDRRECVVYKGKGLA